MPNLPQQNTIIQYTANGATASYDFAFYVPLEGDINVYVTLSGNTPIPASNIKVLNVDYSVTFNSDITTGGYITFLTGKIPANGATVTLSRDVEASLDVEFSNATTFNGANLDNALDRLLLLIQQNKTLINSEQQRVLSYVINAFQTSSNIAANTQIPVLGVNEIWKGQGTGVIATVLEEGADTSTLRSDLANNMPGTDGARLVGYYDAVFGLGQTTVQNFMASLTTTVRSNSVLPGTVIDFAGTTAPTGYLGCDGSAVSRTTYAALFTAIGTTWGTGDGSTTFNLPDFRRRVAVGSGGTGTGTLGNAVGNTGGEETHTLSISEMPSHDHSPTNVPTGPANAINVTSFQYTGNSPTTTIPLTVTAQGGGQAHNIMQPSAVVLKIIKT